MSRVVFLLVLLSGISTAILPAQDHAIPTLTIKEEGVDRKLKVRAIEVSIALDGFLAETIYELDYINHSRRTQEGEFSIKLPEGATVSTYALEVNGVMRPAVSVEKEKALKAYETIKRRGVDPGIVERKEGNVYRTRIFPIPPRTSKKVRIGYIHQLPASGNFQLPLANKESVKEFTLKIGGVDTKGISKGLQLPPPIHEDGKQSVWKATDYKLDGVIKLTANLPQPGKPLLRVAAAPDGGRHFFVQGIASTKPEANLPAKWKSLRLIWDASHSGRWRNIEQEITELRKFWKELGNVEVSLQILTRSLSAVETFRIVNSDAAELENRIRKIRYDGAADFSQIVPLPSSPTLLVSDGVLSARPWAISPISVQDDFFILNSTTTKVDESFFRAGAILGNLTTKNWFIELKQTVTGLRVDGISRLNWESVERDGFFLVTGYIPGTHSRSVTLRPSQSDSIPIPRGEQADEWNFPRRVRAQQRLSLLEELGNPGPITEFSKAERLVSDFTSLIVLELFRDHVSFRIPPPEADLLKKYEEALKTKSDQVTSYTQQGWERKRERYRIDFPWVDETLRTEARTVSIWLHASDKVFPDEKRNKEELAPYRKWLTESQAILEEESRIKTNLQFKTWIEKLDQQTFKLSALRFLPAPAPSGKSVHVSVRGFVEQLGIYTAEAPLLLRKAIQSAGGPNHYGSLSRVFLYRDAARTGYNLTSKNYKPVALQWGDMVVIESEKKDHYTYGAADPFAAPFREVEPKAVFETPGTVRAKPRPGKTTGGDPFGGNSKATILKSTASFHIPALPRDLDETIVGRFGGGESAEVVYKQLLDQSFGSEAVSLATLIEVSRKLFEAGNSELGVQCLSNLLEVLPSEVGALRSYCYWLAEFKETESALTMLKEMIGATSEPATLALLWQDVGRLSGETDPFATSVQQSLLDVRQSTLTTTVLTDLFGRKGKFALPLFADDALPSDIRIVITSIGDRLSPRLVEPDNANAVPDSGLIRTFGDRVNEFLVKRAWPGSYKVSGVRWTEDNEPITVHVEFYTNWARKEQACISKTILIDRADFDLGSIEFHWGE